MTGHAKETTMLWDAMAMTLPIRQTTDKQSDRDEPAAQYVSDPYGLPDLCVRCWADFIGPDGHCPTCDE